MPINRSNHLPHEVCQGVVKWLGLLNFELFDQKAVKHKTMG